MRILIWACLLLMMAACSSGSGLGEPAAEHGPRRDGGGPVRTMRKECIFFESHDFRQRLASSLKGHAWLDEGGKVTPLSDVQVAAQRVSDGREFFVVTREDGSFEITDLSPGAYEVWTCLDGFDELRFRFQIDPMSAIAGFDLYVGPSEASGRRDVVQFEDTTISCSPPPR